MMKNFAKHIWLIALALMLACNFSANVPNTPTALIPPTATSSAVTAETPAPTEPVATVEPPTQAPPTQTSVVTSGTDISYFGMSFTIPSGLANGTQNDVVPQANDPNIPFEVYPAYTRFILQGYPLQGKAFEPKVMVYPAKEFAQMSEGAAMIIGNLKNILAAQRSSPAEPLPFLPLVNAGQIFHAQEKFLSFKNGSGIRYITQFDQAPLPINNTELFYTFQGLTSDGDFYVSIIMPVNLPYLPADNSMNSPTPADGIPFDWEHFENFPNYLNSMIDRLNHTDNPFNPSLETLDALVQSLATYGQR